MTCQRPEVTSEYCWVIKWSSKVLEIQLDRRSDAVTRWHCNIPYQQKRIFICRLMQCKIWCPKVCFGSAILLINDFVNDSHNVFLKALRCFVCWVLSAQLQFVAPVSKALVYWTNTKQQEWKLFFFFFYWRYNPLWVLAFSVIFFHSVLSLLSFLQPLIPIAWKSSSTSSIHIFQVPNRISLFFSIFRVWGLFLKGSPVLFTEFFATF